MVNTTIPDRDTLPAVLAARARAASDGRLAFDVTAGVLGALASALWHPAAWTIPFAVALCLAMFGVWGIAERESTERSNTSGRLLVRVLLTLQVFAILVG